MSKTLKRFFVLFLLVSFVFLSFPGLAQNLLADIAPGHHPGRAAAAQPAIGGYSPVSYFEKGVPEKGKPLYVVTYGNKTYWLTSKAQAKSFSANPEKYVPLFGEYCAYNVSLGRRARIDPERFKIVGGRLLLFHKSGEMDGLEMWNRGSEPKLLEKANEQWTVLRF